MDFVEETTSFPMEVLVNHCFLASLPISFRYAHMSNISVLKYPNYCIKNAIVPLQCSFVFSKSTLQQDECIFVSNSRKLFHVL